MKAIRLHEFGGPDVLRYEDAPEPQPKAGDVLVKVHAIGVNYADILTRLGVYIRDVQFPFVPGFEVSGTVWKLGEGVEGLKEGQRVMGTIPRNQSGGYAEYAIVPAWLLIPMPEHFGFEDSAAFTEVFLTAFIALSICAQLNPGETVLIHAAAGGVGSAAVQLAKAIGAKVFATASADDKLQKVKELGADEIINYTSQDFVQELSKRTNGQGVDVVLESVGGDVFDKSLQCVTPMGRMVAYGVSSGTVPNVDVRQLMARNIKLIGFTSGGLTVRRPDIIEKATSQLMELVKQHKIRPVLGHVMKLSQAAEAHQLISSRRNIGKVVLVP